MMEADRFENRGESDPGLVAFESLQLDIKHLAETQKRTTPEKDTLTTYEATSNTLLETGPAELSVCLVRKINESGSLVSEGFRVGIKKENGEAIVRLVINYPGETATTTVSVEKNDPEKRLPNGLGVQLYQKTLKLIAEISTQKNISILHKVSRTPGMSDTPLTAERWSQIFEPILLREGYQKLGEGEWVKTYQPEP